MSDYTQSLSVNSQSAALLHTLQRHRDILQVGSEFSAFEPKLKQRNGFLPPQIWSGE